MNTKTKKAIILAGLILVCIGLSYVWHTTWTVPEHFENAARQYARTMHNIDFSVKNLNFNLSRKCINISGLSLKLPGEKPFSEIPSATVLLASGTGVYDLICGNMLVERVEINDPHIDFTAPLPSSSSDTKTKSLTFPASALKINGLRLNTSVTALSIADFSCEAQRSGDSLSLGGSFTNEEMSGIGNIKAMISLSSGETMASVKWSQSDFSGFLPLMFLWSYNGLNVVDGSANVDLKWKGNILRRVAGLDELGDLLNKELYGSVLLKNCRFSIFGGSYQIDVDAARLTASDSWKIEASTHPESGGSIDFKTVYHGFGTNITDFDSTLTAKSLTVPRQVLKAAGLPEPLPEIGLIKKASGSFSYKNGEITSSGTALVNNTSFESWNVDSTDLKWDLSNGLLLLNSISKAPYGEITATSSFDVSGDLPKTGSISGLVTDFDMSSLDKILPVSVKGLCSGTFSSFIPFDNVASSVYEADLIVSGGKVFDFAPDILSAHISGCGKDWKVSNPIAEFENGGSINASGEVRLDKIDMKIAADNVELTHFSVPEHIASGSISVNAALTGSLTDPDLNGDVISQNVLVEGLSFESIRGRLHTKDKILAFSPLVAKTEKSASLDGYLSVDLNDGRIQSMNINFQRLSAEELQAVLPDHFTQTEVNGTAAGRIAYDRNRGVDHWDIYIDARNIGIYGHLLDTLYFEGSVLDRHAEITTLFVRAFGGKLTMSGEMNDYDSFSGFLEAESLNFQKIPLIQKYIPELRGICNFQGNLDWDDSQRSGNFTMFASEMKAGDRELGNFGGEITLDNEGMRITSGEFDKLGITLDGKVTWEGRQPFDAELKLDNVDLSFISESHGIKDINSGGLTVNGACSLHGTFADRMIDGAAINLSDIRIEKDNDVIVSNKPINVIYQNGNVEFRSLELKYKIGVLGIEGLYSPGKTASLTMNGKDFSLKALGRLFNLPETGYDGSLSLNARLMGNVDDLNLLAEANIADLNVAGKKIPAVSAKIEANPGKICVKEASITLPTSSFTLNGDVMLHNYRPARLDLHLSIPESPLTDLSFYLPQIFHDVNGKIAGDVALSGRARNPKIVGDLHINADSVYFKGMKKPITDLEIAVSTSKNVVNLDKLFAKSGRGTIVGSGTIDFNDDIGSISAEIKGEKLDITFANLSISGASASADISGDLYNPVIVSKVFIPRGRFTLTSDLFASKEPMNLFLETMKYKIDVEVPRNFWVKHSMLNAEMKGRFVLSGDLNDFKLDGGIDCVQGNMFFQRRKFKIDTGEIRFGGVENSFDPRILVKSEGQVQSTKIFLTLQGTISSFTPQLYSTPPMEEGDLLALLTFGRNLNDTMQSDAKDLFEDEILEGLKNTYISALIGNTISTALNLDELYLTSLQDSASGKSKSYLRVGKYITDKFFMAYEGTMQENEDENYIFEYHLPRGFIVNLEFKQPDEEEVVGVRYDWKF